MDVLVLDQISKRYGPDQPPAVDGLSLQVAEGEIVALLGPSGCGKTTTLRLIAGLEVADAGTITLRGRVVTGPGRAVPPEERGIGIVFQDYALFPHLTVADNVGFGLPRAARHGRRARTAEVLALVGLVGLESRYPHELSGGQQQRVALARAIVVQPTVLLLDEPLSNLDANLREEMRYEIRRLHDEFQITTVYVTHDQAEAMVASDRIAVMNQGRVEQVDAPRALYARPRTRFVASFIGRTNLLDGECRGDDVVFDGFAIPRRAFPEPAAIQGRVAFSLRPQSIGLHRQPPPPGSRAAVVPGHLVQRAYLGEHWDYTVRPAGSRLVLRVTTRPHEVFEVDEKVWLELDPGQMAALQPE